MLKIFIYFPLLLITLGLSAQNQATTFSNVVGFTNDGSGNYTSNSGGWNTNMLTSENFIVPNSNGGVSYTVVSTSDKLAIGLSVANPSIKIQDVTYRMLMD